MLGARSLAAVASILGTIGGCCFTTSETIEVDTVSVEPAAPPPGYDVLSICAPGTLVQVAGTQTPRCSEHASVLPTSATSVVATFHTHGLARFAGGGAVIAGTGDGAGFVEIARDPLRGPGAFDPNEAGLTWNVESELSAPQLVGWPPGVPVRFRVLDHAGAIAFESTTTFTGPPVAPPPPRPIGDLRICLASQLAGPEDDRFCATHAVAVPGGSGELWVTYSTDDRATLEEGFSFVLERRRGESWTEVYRHATEGVPEPDPSMTYTLSQQFDLSSSGWGSGTHWRARLTTTGGRALGEQELDVN